MVGIGRGKWMVATFDDENHELVGHAFPIPEQLEQLADDGDDAPLEAWFASTTGRLRSAFGNVFDAVGVGPNDLDCPTCHDGTPEVVKVGSWL